MGDYAYRGQKEAIRKAGPEANAMTQPTACHEFDKPCAELEIKRRLTKPRSPQTNSMVERCKGNIADILNTQRFVTAEHLEQTIMRYAAHYNTQFPQSALGS